MANYYTLLTPAGLAKVTNAQLTNSKVEITQVAIGDANGTGYKPTGTETALKREVWRGGVTSVGVDTQNPNWIVVEAVMPATVGGFTMREVALYDVSGVLIAIGNYPDTYKPVANDGSTMDLALRTIIEVGNAENVTLKIDPNVIVASRKYVDDKMAPVTAHINQLASKTKIGHMQVGDGLTVTNGIVSANYHVDSTKTLDTPSSDYLFGTTLYNVNVSTASDMQESCLNLINEFMGYAYPTSTDFRFVFLTHKRNTIVNQELIVLANAFGISGTEIFRLNRVAGFNSPYYWGTWKLQINAISFKGNPNGFLMGLRGWLCYDYENGVFYKKTTGLSTAYNSGWVPLIEKNINWVSVTGQNGFLNAQAKYFKNALGEVHLKVNKDNSEVSINSATTIFTLPEGYRPSEELRMITGRGVGEVPGYILIKSNGEVSFYANYEPSIITRAATYVVFKAVD